MHCLAPAHKALTLQDLERGRRLEVEETLLKAYTEKCGVGPGWLFLTGKPDDIKLLAKKLGLSRRSDAANRDGHMALLMLGNEPTGQWMRNSAVDNHRFLATTITRFLGWPSQQPGRSYAELAQPPKIDAGAYLFQSRCAACHTVGKGDAVGPDLARVTTRRARLAGAVSEGPRPDVGGAGPDCRRAVCQVQERPDA